MKKTKRITALLMAMLLMCSAFATGITVKAAEYTNTTDKQIETNTENKESEYSEEEKKLNEETISEDDSSNSTENQDDAISDEAGEEQITEENATSGLINYLGVDKPYLTSPDTQKIVVSYGDGAEEITEAKIVYQKADGAVYEEQMTERQSELFLFEHTFNSEDKGVYTVLSFEYMENGIKKSIKLSDIGIQARFGVDEKYPGYESDNDTINSDDIEVSVVDAKTNEEKNIEGNVEEAISNTAEEVSSYSDGVNAVSTYSTKKDVVVVLDPGHGGSDSGALGYGMQEKNLTLKIAKYCREELEQYSGVKVYMTREDDRYLGDSAGDATSDLANRVNKAAQWGADLLVSIHINAGGGNGVEVYYPNTNLNASIGSQGEKAAEKIQKELVALGLNNRGIHIRNTINDEYKDGSKQDYYGIIRRSKLAGFPGIIVEHAFIDNAEDAKLLQNESFLKKCGIADATGIANYFGLQKGPFVNLDGIITSEIKNGMSICISPNIKTNIDDMTYKYQIYDVAKNTWETIGENIPDSKIEWVPKKAGDYWIHVEANSSVVEKQEYTIGYRVDSDRAYINSFSVDKAQVTAGENIKLKADYEVLQNEKNIIQFLIYDGNCWSDITGNSKDETTWKTKKSGECLACFQITTESGKVFQSFVGIEVVPKKEPIINGIQIGTMDLNGEIKLSANVNANGRNLKYTFKEFDMTKWMVINEGTDTSAIWKPEKSGSHLLYLEVKDEDSNKYSYCMGCSIEQLVKIEKFWSDRQTPQSIGNEITLEVNASVSKSVDATFEYMYYDGVKWHSIQKSSELKSAKWIPENAGNYLLAFQVVTKAGETYQSFMGYTITEPKVSIKGITLEKPNSNGEMELKANVESNDDNLKYTFKAYDMLNWSTIAEQEKKSTVMWKPEKAGSYLIYLEITTSLNKKYTYCMGCSVDDNVAITGLDKNVCSPQIKGTKVILKGKVSALFPDELQYQYLVYDGYNWSTIASLNKMSEVEWIPEKVGQYSICFQVKKKDGKIIQWFESYTITGPDVQINGIEVTGINQNKEIELTPIIRTNDTNLLYTYKVYNMSKWENIATNVKTPSVTWNVEKEGTYLLHLEVKDSVGAVHSYDMGVQVHNNVQLEGLHTNMTSPQQLTSDLQIKLTGDVQADYYQGLIFRYMVYEGGGWVSLSETTNKFDSVSWAPKKTGDYLLCFQVEKETGEQINIFTRYTITGEYYIMGSSSTNVQQMVNFFNANNSTYDKYLKVPGYDGVLASKGAPTISDFCRIFVEEANAEGVKAEVAFCQAMLETGFLQYGGDVKPDQCNFAGLGATGGGEQGNRFETVREGIRAQIQHLKCYASTDPLNNPCVDQRWWNALRGTAPTVEQLSLKWASSSQYGERILGLIKQLKKY